MKLWSTIAESYYGISDELLYSIKIKDYSLEESFDMFDFSNSHLRQL